MYCCALKLIGFRGHISRALNAMHRNHSCFDSAFKGRMRKVHCAHINMDIFSLTDNFKLS